MIILSTSYLKILILILEMALQLLRIKQTEILVMLELVLEAHLVVEEDK